MIPQLRIPDRGHIGIVACSAEGAALCFREIASYAAGRLGEHLHPQVTLSCIAMGDWLPAFDAGDYETLAQIMLRETHIVATAGAQLAICPDNSAHLAFEILEPRSPIPWLHIATEVARAAQARGYRRAALLGTRFTMGGPVYPRAFAGLGMQIVVPTAAEQRLVDDIIFTELVKGVFTEDSRLRYNQVIARLKTDEECDCVVLGCTEIPLLVRADDCPLPTLDSTRLLARSAVDAVLPR
ncbi:MAG: amino acid racemase [Proteobacteria bacterium]|nr:amino acid racemase [Pseudomonadota bacterium]